MKHDISTLEALLERVEAATGPDRVLDDELRSAFGYPPKPWNYTASIDAAIALMRSIYPEVFVELSGPRKYLHIPTPMPNHWRAEIESTAGWGATASLAILSALLRALIAQAKEQVTP